MAKVTIKVSDGSAYVTNNPDSVEVEIIQPEVNPYIKQFIDSIHKAQTDEDLAAIIDKIYGNGFEDGYNERDYEIEESNDTQEQSEQRPSKAINVRSSEQERERLITEIGQELGITEWNPSLRPHITITIDQAVSFILARDKSKRRQLKATDHPT